MEDKIFEYLVSNGFTRTENTFIRIKDMKVGETIINGVRQDNYKKVRQIIEYTGKGGILNESSDSEEYSQPMYFFDMRDGKNVTMSFSISSIEDFKDYNI